MLIAIGILMFFVGLFVGVIIFFKDESWEIQKKKLLDFIYFQLVIMTKQRRIAKDDINRSRYEGQIIAFEKVRDYIVDLSVNEE